MENIISKYEKIVPYIPVSMDNSQVYIIKATDGKYSVEDFFLNRLMRNVWFVSEITPQGIQEGFYDPHLKGGYNPQFQEVSFNTVKLEKQVNSYKDVLKNNFEIMKKTATKKVIMHEFEHALQTRFDNGLYLNGRSIYNELSDEILKLEKYENIRPYNEIKNNSPFHSKYISTGVHFSSYSDNENFKTYRDVDDATNLNEILNETESLEMSHQKQYLSAVIGKNGCLYPYRNPESSNGIISNYGDLFKLVFGKSNSFKLMYINPEIMLQKFNESFNEIFQTEYSSDKDAIELFITAITKIKKENDELDHLKLNNVLALCLEKRIKSCISNPKINNQTLLNTINIFEGFSVTNEDESKRNNYAHIKKINELRELVKTKNNSNESINNVLPIPTFKELQSYINDYELTDNPNKTNSFIVRNCNDNSIVNDKDIIQSVIFANIWLGAAGTRWYADEKHHGEKQAFSDVSEQVYNYFINSIKKNLSESGNINSVEIFKNAELLSYHNSQEIIVNLFHNNYHTKFINNYFRKRVKSEKSMTKETDSLFDLTYASNLAYGNTEEQNINFKK